MRQNDRFGEANLGSAERLADAIGFTDRVRVDQGHCQTASMSKGEKRLMKVRKSGRNGTSVPAAADDKYANWPFQQLGIDSVSHRCAASSFFKYSFNGPISISVDRGKVFFLARPFQRAAVPPLRFVSRPALPGWVNSL